MSIEENHPDFVTAFARGLSVIRCFEKGADRLTLSEIAERTGLTRGTARRFLLTLEAIGYIGVDGRTFRLLPKVLDLGYAYLASMPLWELAQPFMKSIVDQIDESCSLTVLDGADVVYIARVPPTHVFTIPVQVGMRMPAFINAMGQVLLAELDDEVLDGYFAKAGLRKLTKDTDVDPASIRKTLKQVKKQGYAMPVNQVYEGRVSLAVPIRNREGRAIAAMNVSAMLSRVPLNEFTERFLPLLTQAAEQIRSGL